VWIALSFFAINMNAAHKSFLASALALPVHIERIQTVKDMLESDLPLLTAFYFKSMHKNVLTPEEYAKLSKRMVVCVDSFITCLLKFVSREQYCLTANPKQLNFVTSAMPRHAYHRLDKTISSFYLTMFTRRNFFLNRKMTTMILRSDQAGLTDFWFDKAVQNHRICDFHGLEGLFLQHANAKRPVPEANSDSHAHVLTIYNLLSPFLLLGMGLFLAGAIFVIEVLSVNRACRIVGTRFTFTWSRPLGNPKLQGNPKHIKRFPTDTQIFLQKPYQYLSQVI